MQQEPQPLSQLTALAVVIESSLAIAQEWPNPLFQYCMHLFKRINETHHPAKLRGAFVGYATIDTVPSPILCKRFFTENTMVFREIFEEPMHFGIGMSNSGGARGMAALEGLVAALELFDDLHKLTNTKICGSFILHIAASAPDSSLRPEWNDSELMDNMTWESFPAEFKKRGIGYNLLTLGPPKGRLAELYAAMSTGTNTLPWFDLRSSFTLSAAPIVSLKAINKRQNEVPPAEQPPENKRPRLQPTTAHESPKPIPPQPPSDPPLPTQPPEPSPSTQTQPMSQDLQFQAQPQAQSQTLSAASPAHPPQIPNVLNKIPGNQISAEFLERFAMATEVMRRHEAEIQAAIAVGDVERAEAKRVEYEKRKPQYEKMKLAFHYYSQMSAMKQNSAQPKMDVGAPSANMPTGNTNPAMQSQSVANSQDLTMNEMPPSNSSIEAAMPNVTSNPTISIEMQKLMEQNPQTGGIVPVTGVGMQNLNPVATGGESVVGVGFMPPEPHLMVKPSRPPVEWTGTLKWSGQSSNGTREMRCIVTVASALAPEKAHTETWPEAMELVPVEKFPMIQLQEWIKRQQTCLCSFKAFPTEFDQTSYGALIRLLDSVFAVASWTVPSGGQPTRNAIFFVYTQRTTSHIAAAIFPLTGMPDTLPKAILQRAGGVSLPPLPASMPQGMIQTLKSMSPAERQQIMSKWFIHHNIMRQQADLANQQGPSVPAFNPTMQLPTGNQSNVNSAFNMMGGPPQGNFMMNQNSQSQAGLSTMQMIPGAPTGGSSNYEAMQSLMQRNVGQNMGQKTL